MVSYPAERRIQTKQTDRQTDRQTNKQTISRQTEPIGTPSLHYVATCKDTVKLADLSDYLICF